MTAVAQRRDEVQAGAISLYLAPRSWWWRPLGFAVLAFAQAIARACALRATRAPWGEGPRNAARRLVRALGGRARAITVDRPGPSV